MLLQYKQQAALLLWMRMEMVFVTAAEFVLDLWMKMETVSVTTGM